MSAPRGNERSSLRKIEVTCNTCGISDSFYSDASVQRFKARHAGHDVVVGGQRPAPEQKPEPEPERARAPAPAPSPKESEEKDWGTRLPKVVVDVVVFPALRDSVFRVRGFREGSEEAFVVTSRFENGEMVKRFLETGEYVDYQGGGTRYLWEQSAIQFEGETKNVLGITGEPAAEASVPQPEGQAPPDTAGIDDSSVARTAEKLFGDERTEPDRVDVVDSVFPRQDVVQPEPEPVVAPAMEEPALQPEPEPAEAKPPEPELELEPVPEPQPAPAGAAIEPSEPEPEQELQPPLVEPTLQPSEPEPEPRPEPVEVKPPEPEPEPVPAKAKRREPEREVKPAPAEVMVKPSEPEPEPAEALLVSKSWYIQGGAKNNAEAIRVSKVLKDFRWRVEPLYTIGVILDDILSVEASKGQISRALIKGVEAAGYRLTAVTIDQGKPVAWFKRTTKDAPEGSGEQEEQDPELDADFEA